jgi:hypothetical protein
VLVDAAARTVVAPLQLPVGVLAAAIGVPAFIAMLLRRPATRRAHERPLCGALDRERRASRSSACCFCRRLARGRDLFGALDLRISGGQRWVGHRPERRRQVVAAGGDRRRLSAR